MRALRFYGCPELTVAPCAAIQFFGNFANTFGGQLFLDSGAETKRGYYLRTALADNSIAERMRVTGDGTGRDRHLYTKCALRVVGTQPITVSSGVGTDAAPAFEVIGAKGGNSVGLGLGGGMVQV